MNDLIRLRDEAAAVLEDAFCVISGSGRTCEIHEERTEGGRCPRALSAADALLASPVLELLDEVEELRASLVELAKTKENDQ